LTPESSEVDGPDSGDKREEERSSEGRSQGQPPEPPRAWTSDPASEEEPSQAEGEPGKQQVTVLGQLGIDLTEISSGLELTLDGELWENELRRAKEVLERREGHSAVLVGPEGVGKRALVLTLARQIAAGHAPKRLIGRRIIELPFHRIVASVREPSDFEKIVLTAMREAILRNDVILFLGGITSFMGLSALRGEPAGLFNASYAIEMGCHQPGLYLLGSSTPELYREASRAMPSCEGLFERVDVREPGREAAIEIITDAIDALGEYHGVKIEPSSVKAAVDLSFEYIRERVLPGKALDLLDRAAARSATLCAGSGETPVVSEDDVTLALSDWIDIPPDKLTGPGHRELVGLEAGLMKKIRGQDACVRKLADVIRVAKLSLSARPNRPDGVMLFVGPSGVGKSGLARALAEQLYGSESRLLTFNMTRYSGDDAVARLLGVTTAEGEYEGDLTTAVSRNPHSVLVFEHIERTSIDAALMLTQVFRDGYVTNGQGMPVYFSNCTIIMTSNSENIVPRRDDEGIAGFGQSATSRSEKYLQEAKKAIESFFPPEFMDGIDEVLLFDPLSDDALRDIVRLHLEDIHERLSTRSISLEVSEEAVAKIVEKGASREYGARDLGRTVEGMLLKPLARFLVANPDARRIAARVVEGDVEVLDLNQSGDTGH
jgi:ATP-dependent Clp protease ATP-binding subunit ClpA